jgi:hypothetical protein
MQKEIEDLKADVLYSAKDIIRLESKQMRIAEAVMNLAKIILRRGVPEGWDRDELRRIQIGMESFL